MTPSAPTGTKNDSAATSFDRIAEREMQEQRLFEQAAERLQAERVDIVKGLAETEKKSEEALHDEEVKQLAQCKKEIEKEIAQHESDVQKDLKSIESQYQKNAPALVQSQAEALLSLAI